MMNIVAHNLLAMNANRQFGIVNKKKAKSTEKLSSGYKINRAADDAAGLSISEKMRRQIRGLSKATENIQDGISLCQVADGALNETLDILQRMNELSVKAANGTNTTEDREAIQQEISQLSEEIDRIANTTCFNDAIYPLRGDYFNNYDDAGNISGTESTHSRIKIDSNGQAWKIPEKLEEVKWDYFVTDKSITVDGKTYNVGDTFSKIEVGFIHPKLGTNPVQYVCWDGFGNGHIGPNDHPWPTGGELFESSLTFDDLKVDTNGYLYLNEKALGTISYFIIGIDNNGEWSGGAGIDNTIKTLPAGWEYIQLQKYTGDVSNIPSIPKPNTPNTGNGSINKKDYMLEVYIQAGAESTFGNRIKIDLVNATCKGIGVDEIDVVKNGGADKAIDKIKSALTTVNEYRSTFGAKQNRLEHAYNINLNIVENTQDAESRIRDTDIATEIMKHSNDSILQQAGTSMLSQANQMPQYVLQLLS